MDPSDIRNNVSAVMENIRRQFGDDASNSLSVELLEIIQSAFYNSDRRRVPLDMLSEHAKSEDVKILFYLVGFEEDDGCLTLNPSAPTDGLAVLFDVLQDAAIQQSTMQETTREESSAPAPVMAAAAAPAMESVTQVYKASESVESGDPITVSAHLSYHFFMRFFLLSTQSSSQTVPAVLVEQVRISIDAIETATRTLGVMKPQSQPFRLWNDLKEEVVKIVSRTLSSRANLANQMLHFANELLTDMKRECPNPCSSIFYYMHLLKMTLMVTSSGGQLKREDAERFVHLEIPLDRLSEKYKRSFELLKKHFLTQLGENLRSEDIREMQRASLWQSVAFLQNFRSLADPEPDSGLPRCPNAPKEASDRRIEFSSFSHESVPFGPPLDSASSLEAERESMRVQMQEFRNRGRGEGDMQSDSFPIDDSSVSDRFDDNRYTDDNSTSAEALRGEFGEEERDSIEEKEEIEERDDGGTEKERMQAERDDEKDEVEIDYPEGQESGEGSGETAPPPPRPAATPIQPVIQPQPQSVPQSQPVTEPQPSFQTRPGESDARAKAREAALRRFQQQAQATPQPRASAPPPQRQQSSPAYATKRSSAKTKRKSDSPASISISRLSAASSSSTSTPPSRVQQREKATVTPSPPPVAAAAAPKSVPPLTPVSRMPPRAPTTAPAAAAAPRAVASQTRRDGPAASKLTSESMSISVPTATPPPTVGTKPTLAAIPTPQSRGRREGTSPLERRFAGMTIERIPDLMASIKTEQDAEEASFILDSLREPSRLQRAHADRELKQLHEFADRNPSPVVHNALQHQFQLREADCREAQTAVETVEKAIAEVAEMTRRSRRVELTELNPKVLVECIEETLETIRDDHAKMVALLRKWLPYAPRDVLVTICEKLAIKRQGDDPKVWIEQIRKRDEESIELSE